MNPYRSTTARAPRVPPPQGECDGELWLVWWVFLLGALGVAPALWHEAPWESSPTVGLLLALLAGRRLLRHYRSLLG
jgi:hypothetical protein